MLEELEGEPSKLAGFSTSELLSELLHRASLHVKERHYTKALRLINAVLGYAPHDGKLLQWAAEILIHQSDWERAADYAQRALKDRLPPGDWIRTCAVACGASYRTGGEPAAARALDAVKTRFQELLDLPDNATNENLNLAISCGMAAGDLDLARHYFYRRFHQTIPEGIETRLSPLMATKNWCEQNGTLFRVLEPPRDIGSTALPKEYGTWSYTTKGVNLAVIPEGEFLSGLDFIITRDGAFLDDSGYLPGSEGAAWFPKLHDWIIEKILHIWPSEVITVDADAVFLSCPEGMHMGHWQCDFLPRLRALKDFPELSVATCTELPQKHRDLIRLFGVDDSRIINCDLNKRYRFRSLTLVQTGIAVLPEPNNICFITDALRMNPRPPGHPRRIFLERGVKTRAIANRESFYEMLDRFGFERLKLVDLSIAEQRAALSAAEVVITTYGSELLCTFMMSENSHLIELNWDPEKLDAAAAPMSSMVGIKYHLFRCSVADKTGHRVLKKDKDFTVDLTALSKLLRRIGARERQPMPA